MEVLVYIAEERNYGPSDRVGVDIAPWRVFHSFEPIPNSERVISYREFGTTWHRTIRVTGGELPAYRLKAAGELSTWPGRVVFQFAGTGQCRRAEDLLARAQAGAKEVLLIRPDIRPVRRERGLTVVLGPPPIGPIVPTMQTGFAW